MFVVHTRGQRLECTREQVVALAGRDYPTDIELAVAAQVELFRRNKKN